MPAHVYSQTKLWQLAHRRVILRAFEPGSDVGTPRDQLLVLIQITKDDAFIAIDQFTTLRKKLRLERAIFCAAGKAAFISHGVSFTLWSS